MILAKTSRFAKCNGLIRACNARGLAHAMSRQGELESLGIFPKTDKVLEELYKIDTLIENLKQTLLLDYKTAYRKSFE